MNTSESYVRDIVRFRSTVYPRLRKLGWAASRIFFVVCSGLSVTTVVGCFILSPLFCYWFFGNLRFWKYLHFAVPMILYSYYLAYLYLRKRSVPSFSWTAPPMSGPDLSLVRLNPQWRFADSCGDCGKCCKSIRCPFLDKEGHCLSYDTFYWRYFNCGRYPASQREVDFYQCPKWIMRG